MSGEMVPYVVRQGDYLTKLAWRYGFDADEVWNDPKNAELKARRDHMDILMPGDILFIPGKPSAPALPIVKGTTNRYVAKVPKMKLDLTLRDGGKVYANERYVIQGLVQRVEGTTDGDGKLSLEVPVHTREITISLPGQRVFYPVRLGDMDPISELAGVKKRLENLGHYRRPAPSEQPGDEDPEVAAMREAVRRFQRVAGLAETGELDEDARVRIRDAHGS